MRALVVCCFVAIGGCAAGHSADAPGNGGANSGGSGGTGGFGSGGFEDCTTCSADLHSIVRCGDQGVVETCPDDQGCGPDGTCIPACDSASANKSSIGCEYFTVTPDGWSRIEDMGLPQAGLEPADGSCFAAFVNNTWTTPVSVSLEWDGTTFDAAPHARIPHGSGALITYDPLPNGQIPAGEMAIVFLAHLPPATISKVLCPAGITPAIVADPGQHGTGIGQAIGLATSAPTVAYDIYPYGGAAAYVTSATLLLPTSAWDTNYVAVTTDHSTFFPGMPTLPRPSGVTVVAATDGTDVTLLPTQPIQGRGMVAGGAAGEPITYSLNRGQILHLMQTDDLTGTPIEGSVPIGVWGQHYCMNFPQGVPACDPGHQQIPPVNAQGSEYVGVRFRNRDTTEEYVPWRLVGLVDGTVLDFDPPVGVAPATLQQGELATFIATGPFVVRSQDEDHPFYFATHMTGSETNTKSLGDPETVNVIPPAQYLSRYVFFADPTYPETNLVVIRKRGSDGFAAVDLDCAGELDGWTPIGGSDYEYTRVDLQLAGAPAGACDNGRHLIESAAPFGITVWGFGDDVSYAYPAGASVKPINSVEVPPIPR